MYNIYLSEMGFPYFVIFIQMCIYYQKSLS